MVTKASNAKLASCERRYRELAEQLGAIGYMASGSVAQRYNRCGTASCGCHADPPRLHGPYWQWTAKVAGKTVNKRLSEREARLYLEWIANDRKARSLLAQMRAVAAEARAEILAQDTPLSADSHTANPPRSRSARRSSGQAPPG